MAMIFGRRPQPDPYLTKPIETERFQLVNCNQREAIKVTMPWRTDTEVLHNLMMDKPSYSQLAWAKQVGRPDGNKLFYHAIVSKELRGTIGTHRLKLDRSGTANLAIVIHMRKWWGKGVFEEVRSAILDHFSGSENVERFFGRVLSRNFSSVYNYNKLGFRTIGYEQSAWRSPFDEELHDIVQFEMLKSDWLARKKAAET